MNKQLEKNTLITILLMFLFATSGLAIAQKDKEPNIETLANRLELTADQKSVFISVMKANRDKRKAFMKTHREERKIQMDQYHQQSLSDLSEFMDDDQLATFEQDFEARKAKRQARHEDKHEEMREN